MQGIRRFGTTVLAAGLVIVTVLGSGCGRVERRRAVADPASQRVTQTGAVVGFEGRYGSHVWLGIPYARPPVGNLHWRAPQPSDPWSGAREALKSPSPCVQFASRIGGVAGAPPDTPVGNEDCLYLNLYAPRFSPAEARCRREANDFR
jgi:para-nitrobenzyl esterase